MGRVLDVWYDLNVPKAKGSVTCPGVLETLHLENEYDSCLCNLEFVVAK